MSSPTPTNPTHHRCRKKMSRKLNIFLNLFIFVILFDLTKAQCPWPRNVAELNGSCLCSLNVKRELSIHCSEVNFSLLMTALHQRPTHVQFDLLYVNNSNVNVLNDRTFDGLSITNIQFSMCGIYNISTRAFEGLETSLRNLNLQNNKLTQVPSVAISKLESLEQLDLSNNKLTVISPRAFQGAPLTTLKLGDNALQLNDESFRGLEVTLKNINLQGTKLKEIPTSIRQLKYLAFMDLSQNQIRSLRRGSLSSLDSLTALNLERNRLQTLENQAFLGINDTLSSLSLLNNLITAYPKTAINSLTELRVLDIGFNLMTYIPLDAFRRVTQLTLLALDGNPLETVPVGAFTHLNHTLRGLSVGGRFLECDCKISWILEWIRDFDLQVTSREISPQFCGQPPELRDKSFYKLSPEDLNCTRNIPLIPLEPEMPIDELGDVVVQPPIRRPDNPTRVLDIPTRRPDILSRRTVTPKRKNDISTRRPEITTRRPDPPPTTLRRRNLPLRSTSTTLRTTVGASTASASTSERSTSLRPDPLIHRINHNPRGPLKIPETTSSRHEESSLIGIIKQRKDNNATPRRPMPTRFFTGQDEPNLPVFKQEVKGPFVDEVIVQDAYRKDNSVIIQWDSEVSNILGFRVVYRLFGDKQFKLGPPLASSEREFKIRNVPTQECVVVCVVSLEDVNVAPDNVDYEQCREIRTESSTATHMDTIIIAASAAICGTVIIAVVVFICCNRRRGSGRHEKNGLPSVLSPISPPLASLGALGVHNKADWDTMSMYSQRSIPRARMYHMDKGSINNGYIPDDARSHISHISAKSQRLARSLADGQSQRSYSALSNARNLGMGQVPYMTPMGLSRPDLRMSHQSLVASQLGGFTPGLRASLSRAPSQRSDRRRSRPKSRERSNSRLSHAGSSHSLTGYDTDGWTDHDMDIYMARNPTRGGLVQL